MCGFIGIFERNIQDSVKFNLISSCLDKFSYRGPDEKNIVSNEYGIMGFNRLAINHINNGRQPKTFKSSYDTNNNSFLCFNGEIFNHKELEEKFLESPYIRDEVTVLVELYIKLGLSFVNHLNGQFSIAIIDASDSSLTLIRDPLGIRPLFFYNDLINKRIIFGSDINSFWDLGVEKSIDNMQLSRVHMTWSSSPDRTIWKNINQVKLGNIIKFSFNGNNINLDSQNCYWNWPEKISNSNKDIDIKLKANDEEIFKRELRQSVSRQSMSEVGLTSYLSGGIDSSVLAYELSKLNKNLKTFSVTFEDAEYDESDKQHLLVSKLGLSHCEYKISDQQISDNFIDVSTFIQQPFFRTAPIPLYLLAHQVKESDNKVVITGEGADELLLGYDIFREQQTIDFIQKRPESRWRYKVFDNLYSYLPQFRNPRYRKLAIDTLMREGSYGLLNPLKSRLSNNLRSLQSMKKSEQMVKDIVENLLNEYQTECQNYSLDGIDIIQLFEFQNLLSGYLLSSQGDRVSMANSVESRYPYLDLKFIKYCLSLPRSFKLKANNFKRILRKSYSDVIPKQIVNAPKIAYQSPEARAILKNKSIKNYLINHESSIFNIYDSNKVKKIVSRITNSNSGSNRGGFSDNMTISILASLGALLHEGSNQRKAT